MILAGLFSGPLTAADNSQHKFKIGFSERFRFVGWDNAINLQDEDAGSYNWLRFELMLRF